MSSQEEEKISKQKNYKSFKQNSLEKRKDILTKQLNEHPTMVPVIVEWDKKSSNLIPLDRKKYLLERSYKFGQFMTIIKNKLKVKSTDSIVFLVSQNKIVSPEMTMGEIYEQYKDNEDGFLYIYYSEYSTFGCNRKQQKYVQEQN
ncbi:hypothetical protein PPERSA_09461 [Pseudocohnilembus persalinus]|uniref:Autophagy-related protein n=1 Tax=Pseudocohnilembus persalinus TaxID=266149 RepID=A0A0V0Q8V5_PSEPJ|nr:hypothetical protein PPERSA_09461 [Pseudocohnilembus persalinus]|eukprot:KRW98603.1 hypothetical protein PPERSA_09461 [Pseudocohnilembus persalinus]